MFRNMENNNINQFKKDPQEDYKLYLNNLVKVVSGYLLNKGYNVHLLINSNNEIQALLILEDVIVSVRLIFSFDCSIFLIYQS